MLFHLLQQLEKVALLFLGEPLKSLKVDDVPVRVAQLGVNVGVAVVNVARVLHALVVPVLVAVFGLEHLFKGAEFVAAVDPFAGHVAVLVEVPRDIRLAQGEFDDRVFGLADNAVPPFLCGLFNQCL